MSLSDVGTWLTDHIYVPIIIGIVIVAFLMLLIYCCVRRNRIRNSYHYKRLEYDVALAEQLDREMQQKQEEVRDSSYLKCQYYLRSHPVYSNITQLLELGSRIDKHWFRVRDKKGQVDRMLCIMPYNPKMVLPFSHSTCKTLKDLFSLLQHPYVFPMTDFDFALEQKYIITIQPISMRGSLKDFIYQSRFQDSWSTKYNKKKRGLTVQQTQMYGREILEALLFLEEKEFPFHGSIHSGNVMFQDGFCRLAGYENTFLGNTSRIYPLIKKKLKEDNKGAIDVLCFGHLLFEMCYGYELDTAHPGPQHLVDYQAPAVVEVFNFIFENLTGKYPTIREICQHPFFSCIEPVELRHYNPAPFIYSQQMKTLLRAVKRGKPFRKRKLKSSSKALSPSDFVPVTPTTPNTPLPPPPPPPPSVGFSPPPPPSVIPSISPPVSGGSGGSRGALLSSIHKGTKLRKTITNDRSAPKI